MSSNSTRALIEASGYQVRFRKHDWVECLITGDGESWVGHGVDESGALDAAVHLACPTTLSRRLLERALGEPSAEPLPAAPPRRATPAPTAKAGGLPSVMVKSPSPDNGTPTPVNEPKTPGQIAVIVSRPSSPRAPSGVYPVPSMSEPRTPEPRTVADPEEALEELDILMDRIRDSREELGLCAPDRQRLAMLAWICLARSHTDGFPDDLRIRDRVTQISRQLTEIGKTFWPGSVTALQLHMQPRDLPRHLLGGVATTWRRAAELAEQALRNKEHEDERRGYDHQGWADGKQTFPRPAFPERLLVELVEDVERLSGPLDLQAAPTDTSIRPDSGQFQRWVRQLRWLRGAEVDPDRWARLAGRFRWWAFRREPALHPAARELEPGYVPTYPWATLLGQDPERRRHERRLRDVLGATPDLGEDPKKSVLDWLTKALPFGDTHHGNIVSLMAQHGEIVTSLSPDDLPDADRRLRRRLVRLQEDLREAKADLKVVDLPRAQTEDDESVDVDKAAPESNGVSLPSDLVERVRTVTVGKRSVFVSNRRDPDLQACLQDAFGFKTLDCRIAEPRRVEQLGEAIEDGQYDLVLGATGFQSHTLDNVLARACRSAGVHYVRVNHGRPLTCLRAVARDFGR